MNIPKSTISDLLDAHRKLDSVQFPPQSEKVRYAIARNIRVLESAAMDLLRARSRIISEVSNGSGTIKKDTPEADVFMMRSSALLDEQCELKLFSISYPAIADQAPPTVIAVLWDVLVGMPDIGEPDL